MRKDEPLYGLELIRDYWQFAQTYYVKHGRPTSDQTCIRLTLRPLRLGFSRFEAKDFTALKLQELRESWIQQGLARTTINQNMSRVKRMFRWAVSQEKVPPATYQSLQSVAGLKKGRWAARDDVSGNCRLISLKGGRRSMRCSSSRRRWQWAVPRLPINPRPR